MTRRLRYQVYSYDRRQGDGFRADQRREGGWYALRADAEAAPLDAVLTGGRTNTQVMREDGKFVTLYDEHDIP